MNERPIKLDWTCILARCRSVYASRKTPHPLKGTQVNDVPVIAAELWLEGYAQGYAAKEKEE